jgi:hypothetical protein
MACQHGVLQFMSGDYYVTCTACHARWGRLSNDGRPEYRVIDGTKIGCAPEESNRGFFNNDPDPYRWRGPIR